MSWLECSLEEVEMMMFVVTSLLQDQGDKARQKNKMLDTKLHSIDKDNDNKSYNMVLYSNTYRRNY